MKQRIDEGFNPQQNRGRHKRSWLESSFQHWLSENFSHIHHETEFPFKRYDQQKTYFADFYFPSLNLIIELDGTQHENTKDYDLDRDLYISSNYNVKVIRISYSEYISKHRIDEIQNLLIAI
jgi:very-short-patch-repair endonuclease